MAVPPIRHRGNVLAGLRISPAKYPAAFHPPYANPTKISPAASLGHCVSVGHPPADRWFQSPLPERIPPTASAMRMDAVTIVATSCSRELWR